MKTTQILAISALAGLSLAAAAPKPTPAPKPFLMRRDDDSGDLKQVTMIMVNKMSNPVSTSVVSNAGVPALVTGGDKLVGTLAPQATATLVAELGWSGNVGIVEAKDGVEIVGNTYLSLLEFGLTTQGDENKFDVDASYVNGYSNSITCTCNDNDDTFLSGCPKDLWSLGDCNQDGEKDMSDQWGSCSNPYRDAGTGNGEEASPFFQPCQHKAYTYYNDDTANSNGVCTSGSATCCIGTEADGC